MSGILLDCGMFCNAAESEKLYDFSYDLFKLVLNKDKKENVLISPYSILEALTLLEKGADGTTLKEFLDVVGDNEDVLKAIRQYKGTAEVETEQDLELGDVDFVDMGEESKAKPFTFNSANSLWLNKDLGVELLETYDKGDSEIFERSFNKDTVKEVNNWVKTNTNDMIPSILNEIDGTMVLVNALAFEANWADEMQDIGEQNFRDVNENFSEVPFISDSLNSYYDVKGGGKLVKKDYKGRAFQFWALLPPEDTSLEEYISSLDYNDLLTAEGISSSPTIDLIVRIKMPKFKYDYTTDLVEYLEELGLKTCFSFDKADFSKMLNTPSYVSSAKHKTHIELDEYGTKAAAVTAMVMELASAAKIKSQKIVDIVYNRPFAYLIVDTESNVPVFIGVVNSVSKGE